MSASCPKQTSGSALHMSAFGVKADVDWWIFFRNQEEGSSSATPVAMAFALGRHSAKLFSGDR